MQDRILGFFAGYFFALFLSRFVVEMKEKRFWEQTKFLLDACEKELGVKCMCSKATIQGVEQCAIIPLEKYGYVLFEIDFVKFLKKVPEEELILVIKNSFREKIR